MPKTKPWHITVEEGCIFMYKGDVKLNRSECLAGKSTGSNTDMDLGPVLEVRVEVDKLKVSWCLWYKIIICLAVVICTLLNLLLMYTCT